MLHCTTTADVLHNLPQICQHLTQISMHGVAALLPNLTKINLFVTGTLEAVAKLGDQWHPSKDLSSKRKKASSCIKLECFLVLWISTIFVSVELKTYQKVHLSTGVMHLPDFLYYTENLILSTDSEINVD